MKIAVYSRKSKYTGKGESVENQIELCREYIRTRIPEAQEGSLFIYEDEGFSAKNLDRPQFRQMMAENDKEKFDYIVVYRLDRISRNVSDFSALIERLNARQTAFVCIKEQFDTSTPMGRAMMYIASVFAQLERETIAERVRDNMLLLARTGRWLGGTTPTGFTSEREETVFMDGKTKTACKLSLDETEIEAVRQMYEKFLELHSINGVSKFLEKQGVLSRSKAPYSLIGIKQILSNPVYCTADLAAYRYFSEKRADVCFEERDCSRKFGLIAYNKRDYKLKSAPRQEESQWILAIGKHRGIITGEEWVRVQEILAENKPDSSAAKPHNGYSLLSGRIFCRQCGSRMFAKFRSRDKGKADTYDYVCQQKLRCGAAACSCKNLGGVETDEAVFACLLGSINGNASLYKRLEALCGKTAGADRRTALENQIQKCRSEIERLLSSLSQEVSGTLVRYVDSRVTGLDEKCRALEKEKAALEEEAINEAGFEPESAARFLADFRASFKEMPLVQKRELIKRLVERIEWDGENLDIFLKGAVC